MATGAVTGMLECVVNVSEGRDADVLAELAEVCGEDLLDLHRDPDHHRSVFTLVGAAAPRRLTRRAVALLDLGDHAGVHPRFGVVDVVPFVPLGAARMVDAVAARDAFSHWAADELGLPCFRYGDARSLPELRRGAFDQIAPDTGPGAPHPTAGACMVGARKELIAYNVWVAAPDLAAVRRVAAAVRTPEVRTLGLAVGARFQVSCNLVAPAVVDPAAAVDAVHAAGAAHGVTVTGTELVGLVPRAVLEAIDPRRWAELDLAADRTIEARLEVRAAGETPWVRRSGPDPTGG